MLKHRPTDGLGKETSNHSLPINIVCCKLITSLDICLKRGKITPAKATNSRFEVLFSCQDPLPHHAINSLAPNLSATQRFRLLSPNFLKPLLSFLFFSFVRRCHLQTYPCVAWSITLSHNESKCQWQHRVIIKIASDLLDDGLCFCCLSWQNEGLVKCLCASSRVGSDILYLSSALLALH